MKKELIKRPLITEKLMNSGLYAFAVDIKASKKEITKAIKEVFGVDTVSIRTVIVKGKTKKSWKTRKSLPAAPWKKAILRLRSGQKIEMFETETKK
ncbi:50S ribosomal protein L23 [Candidatus Shapirobacteria bacterium CG08_land_8_20_14_0_20_39_18]|uniref:Large ribosomal subunit protein uL23 n=1 Tax=Candidatus Shapirobacteria bacterium CG08_land_8_20_14_0_20_39_18 TaxID=1974883 RepID=A0A2M6XCA2_9BACT|nr:MAG: 50S ribosomal protein L23 [Candidatus Shapirobacteria bacterium CG08_land_8_20_14_0_20_39_18]PIY66404.1 MAG: 50S ribosomal protein L23 [Candidatus Shapirobacteria bacterium CG_4_10_14_0_8_um_filter_39_15]PJE68430.1 MAG: 50S ribosomal protein L23 [Candidatus Shapirobacteria bacterium CG10_big_fil_rev_8_21_14_0_10_38_8]